MQLIDEIWRDIKGFEGYYQISNIGNVKSLNRFITCMNNGTECKRFISEKILKQHIDCDGYCRINLIKDGCEKGFGVHRLVAEAFILNPENKPTVNHIDGNKQNNHVDNLEWATYQEQNDHAVRIGLRSAETMRPAYEKSIAKLKRSVICVETGEIFESQIEAERQLGLCSTAVWHSVHTGKHAHGTNLHFKEFNNAVN